MRKRLVFIIAPLLVAALAGCTQLRTLIRPGYFETVSPRASGITAGTTVNEFRSQLEAAPRTAVLLPFADYSSYDSPARHVEIHALLQDALLSELQAAGLASVTTGRDVVRLLIKQGMILDAAAILRQESPRTALLLHELNFGGWSDAMKERIGRAIHQNVIGSLGEEVDSTPLAIPAVQGIGAVFSADYVIRGRITVYQSGIKWGPYPRPETALAFHFEPMEGKTPFMGVAELASYEFFEGFLAGPPRETVSSEDNPLFTRDNVKVMPLVRLDIFVQDARTGEVVFVNATEVRSAGIHSVTTHGATEPYDLADPAIRRAADDLLQPLQ